MEQKKGLRSFLGDSRHALPTRRHQRRNQEINEPVGREPKESSCSKGSVEHFFPSKGGVELVRGESLEFETPQVSRLIGGWSPAAGD